VNGRSYTGTPGSTYDVPDFDAGALAANGWIDCGISCATSERPVATAVPNLLYPGLQVIDTTLSEVIRWDGAAWRNVLTGASV
jgi:hypothetical protein